MTGQLTGLQVHKASGSPCACALLFFAMTILDRSVLKFFQPAEITAAVRRFVQPCVA